MKYDLPRLRRKVHFTSGIVLAVFITNHFLNHALGLISVEAMEAVRQAANLLWRSYPGTILLYGALFSHFAMALDSIYRRRTLRMPRNEVLKILFGLSLPFLLVSHVIGTRVEWAISGYDVGYPVVLLSFWQNPGSAVVQSIALVLAWIHGCFGIWFWLRGRQWFPRYQLLLFSIALLVPVLALLGFSEGAQSVAGPMPSESWFMAGRTDPLILRRLKLAAYAFLLFTIGITLIARAMPARGRIRISYPDGRVVPVTPGFSVLEASRLAGIPHLAVCGGRGRCSTCRVRVTQGIETLPLPSAAEKATLVRIRAPSNVRLSCQLHPTHDLAISPVLEADSLGMTAQTVLQQAAGYERKIAVLFCDLRDFTRLAEHKLPFDTVFLLNRYFEMVSDAVEKSGGTVDKFIGDGALALFGLETTLDEACIAALAASREIAKGIEALNAVFDGELDQPLRIAMGIHAGPAIIGQMGRGKASGLTAVGDTINIASRLEGLAKQSNAELAVSAKVVTRAGLSMTGQIQRDISIRGRQASIETWIIHKLEDLDDLVPSA